MSTAYVIVTIVAAITTGFSAGAVFARASFVAEPLGPTAVGPGPPEAPGGRTCRVALEIAPR